MSEVEQVFNEFWASIVMPDGEWDLEQVKKELYDYRVFMQTASEVYDHITCGAISKINTKADVIISVADDLVNELIRDALEERGLEGS